MNASRAQERAQHPALYKDPVMLVLGCSAIAERHRPVLGFCFSFPVDHQALDAGTLIQWTKGFENPGAVGADPAKLLRQAFERQARVRRRLPVNAQSCIACASLFTHYLDAEAELLQLPCKTGVSGSKRAFVAACRNRTAG